MVFYSVYCLAQYNMPSPLCVVNGCHSRNGITKHRFPKNDTPRFLVWVKRSGNRKLLNMAHEKIYESYVMCDLHFDSSCHSPGTKKLNHNSTPTLLLPECEFIYISVVLNKKLEID